MNKAKVNEKKRGGVGILEKLSNKKCPEMLCRVKLKACAMAHVLLLQDYH